MESLAAMILITDNLKIYQGLSRLISLKVRSTSVNLTVQLEDLCNLYNSNNVIINNLRKP